VGFIVTAIIDGRWMQLLCFLFCLFSVLLVQICQTTDSLWQAVEGAIMGMTLSLLKYGSS